MFIFREIFDYISDDFQEKNFISKPSIDCDFMHFDLNSIVDKKNKKIQRNVWLDTWQNTFGFYQNLYIDSTLISKVTWRTI